MSALSCPEATSFSWHQDDEGFILEREGEIMVRATHSPSGLILDVSGREMRILRKGFLRPRLCIQDGDGNILGKVVGLYAFEPRIEMEGGDCYLPKVIKEGLRNYAVYDSFGSLVMESLDTSTWDSPSMMINLYRTEMDDAKAALLASVSLFIFLDQLKTPSFSGFATS